MKDGLMNQETETMGWGREGLGVRDQQMITCGMDKQYSTAAAAQLLSNVYLFVTPRTPACQLPLSMGFSWQ